MGLGDYPWSPGWGSRCGRMMVVTAYESLCATLKEKPKRWLVTGAAGFIGSHLVERLLALGQTVTGLDDFSTGHGRNLDEARAAVGDEAWRRFRLVEGDVADGAVCREACGDVDYVLHHAALASVPASVEDPLACHRSNVTGFLELGLAARDGGAKRLVYASSSAVYGDDPQLPKREGFALKPLSPYAATKVMDELYAMLFGDLYGLSAVGLRYFNVFGPRQDPKGAYAAVIPSWISLLVRGEEPRLYGDGSQTRDFCHVADVVQANLLAACAGPELTGRVYNVAGGRSLTVLELFDAIRSALAEKRPWVRELGLKRLPERAGDIRHSSASIEAITADLGFAARHDMASGLAESLDWYLEHP